MYNSSKRENCNKRKVNFFMVGAAKCGTTSMFRYLLQHPDVTWGEIKEPEFFSTKYVNLPHKGPKAKEFDEVRTYRIEDYEFLYRNVGAEKIIGDASTTYIYHEQCADDIKKYNPDAKILIMLRNPAVRAFSAYMHMKRDQCEKESFLDVYNQSNERVKMNYVGLFDYAGRSLYADRVEHYINIFGKDKVKVIVLEEFEKDKDKVMDELCDFLEISHFKFDLSRNYNVSGESLNKRKTRMIENMHMIFNQLIPKRIRYRIPQNLRWGIREFFYKKGRGDNIVKVQMTDDERKIILSNYLEDIKKLEIVLGRKLECWHE